MTWIRLSNFEYSGYVADIDSHALPVNAVSYVQNMHCADGILRGYDGYTQSKSISSAPLWLLSGGFGSPWLLAACSNSIHKISSISDEDISNTLGHTSVGANAWTGGVLHGLGILNNGVDAPQYWNGGTNVANLTSWPANTSCRAMRVFKNYLFALGLTESYTDYPTVVRWSTPADPGALPASWDYSNPANDSGRTTLSETSGEIVDGLANGDIFHIYKDDCIYDVTFIGGVYIFKFTPRHYNFGLLSRNCAISYAGRAYALGVDDVVVHLGSELKSIASRVIRRKLFNELNPTYRKNSFVTFDPVNKEIMFCIPVNGEFPSRAFTYNPSTERWGERDLPNVGYITYGKTVLDESGSWDSDSGTWDSDTGTWGTGISIEAQTYMAGAVDSKLLIFNTGSSAGGSAMVRAVERRSLDFGTEQSPNEQIKFISRVRPNIRAENGAIIYIKLGSQMKLSDEISWSTPQAFIVGTTRDLCFRVNGRYISWSMTSESENWELESIDFDVKMGAMW